MAEREGFEPSVHLHVHTLSRRAPSTSSDISPKVVIHTIYFYMLNNYKASAVKSQYFLWFVWTIENGNIECPGCPILKTASTFILLKYFWTNYQTLNKRFEGCLKYNSTGYKIDRILMKIEKMANRTVRYCIDIDIDLQVLDIQW